MQFLNLKYQPNLSDDYKSIYRQWLTILLTCNKALKKQVLPRLDKPYKNNRMLDYTAGIYKYILVLQFILISVLVMTTSKNPRIKPHHHTW